MSVYAQSSSGAIIASGLEVDKFHNSWMFFTESGCANKNARCQT
jgi:hypothetical protein